MGIIIKQSIKGSFWSYLGVLVGFVTTSYLYPKYLSTDTIGLFSILLSYSIIFAQFSGLGFHGITSRLFPYFRDKKNEHNGFIFLAFLIMAIGFILFLLFFISVRPLLIESNLEKSKLFTDYINLLIPITFFNLLFFQLDVYNKLLYNTVLGTFLQEFLQRILIFLVTILFVFGVLNLQQLILAFAGTVCVKGVIIFVYLLVKSELKFQPKFTFINKDLRKEMISVALFNILTGLGGSIVFNIDKILINQILGLGATGVYTIAFFFGTFVIIPSRPLLRISGTLIAEAFKKNDLAYISDIYKKSCLNQYIIGAFLFGGIWLNIANILTVLGPEYAGSKWVIFFIGIAYLFDMLTGANAQIIAYSTYYRVMLYFILILILLVVASIYILVPIWGITGGAVAIAISIFVNNIMRYVFLNIKFKMQPFNYKILLISGIFAVAYFASSFLPQQQLIVDIILRSSLFSTIFFSLIVVLKISEDIDVLFDKYLQKIITSVRRKQRNNEG